MKNQFDGKYFLRLRGRKERGMGMNTNSELLWLTDLHLERMLPRELKAFHEMLARHVSDQILITGDISLARRVLEDLDELSNRLPSKKIYFVLGNHDFFGGSVAGIERSVSDLCTKQSNLIHLDGTQIIPISKDTCLIGHRGWADGRAGLGDRSWARIADFFMISELSGSREEAFKKIAALGDESAEVFRNILPLALSRYRNVIAATHVPPFRQGLRFGDQKCKPARYPHFVNIAAGMTIGGIAKEFPNRKISVICGHTHTPRSARILPNLSVEVGAPRFLNTLTFAA